MKTLETKFVILNNKLSKLKWSNLKSDYGFILHMVISGMLDTPIEWYLKSPMLRDIAKPGDPYLFQTL